jgi:hypothetical protein
MHLSCPSYKTNVFHNVGELTVNILIPLYYIHVYITGYTAFLNLL